MIDIFNVVTKFVKSSWSTIAKFIVVSSTLTMIYLIVVKGVVIYAPSNLIKFSSEQLENIDSELNESLLDNDLAEMVGVSVYQPDGIPKKKIILLNAKGKDKSFADVLKLHYVHKEGNISDSNVYDELQQKASVLYDGHGNSQLDYIIQTNKCIKSILVIGLYKWATPYGAYLVALKEPHDSTIDYSCYYRTAKVLEDEMFNKR